MSIAFLEPVYPAPGHVHRGELQLVEVSSRLWPPRLQGLLSVAENRAQERAAPSSAHLFSGSPWG